MANYIGDQLFNVIDTIVQQRLSEVHFDETIQCSVVRAVQGEPNWYEVKNKSTIYKAVAKDGDTYREDDMVYVGIPQGDYTAKEKLILGKYITSSAAVTSYTNPFADLVVDKTISIGPISNFELKLGTPKQLCNVQLSKKQDLNNLQTTLPGYDYMGLEFSINAQVDSIHGNWAIAITLQDKKGFPLDTQVFHSASGETVSEYLLSSDEIQGNPYKLTPNFKQRILYHIADTLKLQDIASVNITLYQNNDFDNPGGKLALKQLDMLFGYDVTKFLDAPIHLYVEGNYDGQFNYTENSKPEPKDNPQIKALIVDQEKKQLVTELPENQFLAWYEYVIGEKGDEFGGAYWKRLDDGGQTGLVKDMGTNKYELQDNRPTSKIKAVLCENIINTKLDLNKLIGTLTIDVRDQEDKEAWNQNNHNKAQIICIPNNINTYNFYQYDSDDSKEFQLIGDSATLSDFYLHHWLAHEVKGQIQKGNLYAFVHTCGDIKVDSVKYPTQYYEYDGANWQHVKTEDGDLDTLEPKVIATSKAFEFVNTTSEVVERTGQVQIITDRTQLFYYEHGKLLQSVPIQLTIEPTNEGGIWPGKTLKSERPSCIKWEILRGGQLLGLSESDDEDMAALEKPPQSVDVNQRDDGTISMTVYCYLRPAFQGISNAQATSNVIQCIVDNIYTARIEFSLGERSTMGTNYTFRIEPVNFDYIHNTPNQAEIDKYQVKASLYTHDGIELDPTNYSLQWDWEQKNQYWQTEEATKKDFEAISSSMRVILLDTKSQILTYKQLKQQFTNAQNIDHIKVMVQQTETPAPEWTLLSDYEDKVLTPYQTFLTPLEYMTIDAEASKKDKYHATLILNHIFNNTIAAINSCNRATSCFKKAKFILTAYDKSNEVIEEIKDFQGSYWNMSWSGTTNKPAFGPTHCCNTHILKATCTVNVLQREGNDDIAKTITLVARCPIPVSDEKDMDAKAEGIFELRWDNNSTLITDLSNTTINNYQLKADNIDGEWSILTNTSNFPYSIENNQLQKKDNSGDIFINNAVCISYYNTNDKKILWQQPLMQTVSQYDYQMANEWSGGIVTLGADNATIMATAMGAGTKDSATNTFTGVLMGSLIDVSGNTKNGLYGFNQGLNTFGIDARTGDAYFKGHVDALSGTIGGWQIQPYDGESGMAAYNTGIYKDHGLVRVGMKVSGTSSDNAFYVVEFEDDTRRKVKEDGGYRFCVTHGGKLTATEGTIAGWKIGSFTDGGEDEDWAEQTTYSNSFSSPVVEERGQHTDLIGAYRTFLRVSKFAGDKAIAIKKYSSIEKSNSEAGEYRFYVKQNGDLYAKNAEIEGTIIAKKDSKIASWHIGQTSIQSATTDKTNQVVLKTDGDVAFAAGVTGDITDANAKDAFFQVWHNGNVVAKNLSLTGATVTGTIYADTGTVGGWTIGAFKDKTAMSDGTSAWTNYSGSLYADAVDVDSENKYMYRVFLRGDFAKSSDTAIGVKRYDYRADNNYTNSSPPYSFYVTHEGNAYIGGWYFSLTNGIYSGHSRLQPDGRCEFYPQPDAGSNEIEADMAIVRWNTGIRLKGPKAIAIYNSSPFLPRENKTTPDTESLPAGIRIFSDGGSLRLHASAQTSNSYGMFLTSGLSSGTKDYPSSWGSDWNKSGNIVLATPELGHIFVWAKRELLCQDKHVNQPKSIMNLIKELENRIAWVERDVDDLFGSDIVDGKVRNKEGYLLSPPLPSYWND